MNKKVMRFIYLFFISNIKFNSFKLFFSHCVDLTKQEPIQEEFSDWPHGLLAIGTFGNNDLKETPKNPESENPPQEEDPTSSEDLLDFTQEEIGKLQKELTKLLSRKPSSNKEKEIAELPLDKFLNCPSSLDVDRRISATLSTDSDDKDEDIERTISVILGKCREVCADNGKKSIGKRSVSFLLKKMFVCRSGFAPAPSLRDTLQESRMEKVIDLIPKQSYQLIFPGPYYFTILHIHLD